MNMTADKLLGTKTGAKKLFGDDWQNAKKKPTGLMGMFHDAKHGSKDWQKAGMGNAKHMMPNGKMMNNKSAMQCHK